MTIKGVSDNVQALLVGMGNFKTVLPHAPYEDTNFEGYPSACHYYVDAESDYATVSQNRRVIQYNVELYWVTKAGAVTPEAEFERMYELTDEVMQLFDESYDLSLPGVPGSKACEQVRPTPSSLLRVPTPDGEALMMTVTLFCKADVAFR